MDKVVIVTGAGQGIGFAISKVYLENGYKVSVCTEKPIEKFPQCVALQEQYKDHYLYSQTDVTDLKAIDAFVYKTVQHFGRLDVLVSNAGVNVFKGVDCSVEDFEFNVDLNFRSHWYMSKACRPHLAASHGVILIMSSNHGFSTIPMCSPYNMTKRALQALVQSITIEWGPHIRAVAIAPGFIDTEGNQAWFDSHEDPVKARQETVDIHPVGRIGRPEEIGELCLFLSDNQKAGFIAGTTILVDGGRSCVMQDHL